MRLKKEYRFVRFAVIMVSCHCALFRIVRRRQPDIRFSLALGKDEMDYRLKRIPKVMSKMQSVLGQTNAPKDLFEVSRDVMHHFMSDVHLYTRHRLQ